MVCKIEQAAKMLERLEGQLKPGRKVFVWHKRGDYYENKEGEKLLKEEMPGGENVVNIIITAV